MKKNKFLVSGVIVVLAIFVCVFYIMKNNKFPENNSSVPATVSIKSVINDTSSASAILAGGKVITWQTGDYPKNVGLNINLVRKISDSPREFTLVRTLATDTPNNGSLSWVPEDSENTNDLYVEVTCSTTHQFNAGCSLSSDPIKLD